MKSRKAVAICLYVLFLLVFLIGAVPQALSEPVQDLQNEADGSKIEKIDIFWITPDKPADDGLARHLYLQTSDDRPLTMQFQIEVSFSGQCDYNPGDITIRFPAQIWRQRGGEPGTYGGMTYSVPEAPMRLLFSGAG